MHGGGGVLSDIPVALGNLAEGGSVRSFPFVGLGNRPEAHIDLLRVILPGLLCTLCNGVCLLTQKSPLALQRFSHMALDGDNLRPQLLDAHVEVCNLTAAALEAVPELGRAGSSLLKLKG